MADLAEIPAIDPPVAGWTPEEMLPAGLRLGSIDDLCDWWLRLGRSQGDVLFDAGGGFDYMVHKGPLVDVLLGVEYQHFDVRSKNAFFSNIAANNYDLEAKGDIVRARLTIKTSGYSFFYR